MRYLQDYKIYLRYSFTTYLFANMFYTYPVARS